MSKIKKRVLNTISYFITLVVVVFAMLTVGVKLFGIHVYTVLSGSMEPTYRVGSLIYVVKTNTNTLQEGDVITFKIENSTVVTHRIIEVTEDEKSSKIFYTKGDRNDIRDEVPIEVNKVIGKPIFTIPYLGYVTTFIKTKIGKILTIVIGIILILITIFIDLITDEKKKEGSRVWKRNI